MQKKKNGNVEVDQVIKINADEKSELVVKKMKLTMWFMEKDLKFGHRQAKGIFYGQLASRIIDIMENEPENEIAKILKGK